MTIKKNGTSGVPEGFPEMTTLVEFGVHLHELYESFRSAGFSEEQAFSLVQTAFGVLVETARQ